MTLPIRSLALAAACLLSACATSNFQPPVGHWSKPDPAKAYLYGSFKLNGISDIHAATNNYPGLGLRFVCEGDEEFTVGLAPLSPDQLFEVPARLCSLKTFTGNNAMSGRVMSEQRYRGTALQNVRFAAGTLHYAGDVTGEFATTPGKLVWRLTGHVNRYAETTARVLAETPSITTMPRLDVSGVPTSPVAALRP